MQLTASKLIELVAQFGEGWQTLSRHKPFACVASESGIEITPSTGKPRMISRSEIDRFCAAYSKTRSPTEYHDITFNSSYLLAIINRLGCDELTFALPEEIDANGNHTEGAVRKITINAYERDPLVRRKCIEAHGAVCAICGFDFGVVYGPAAKGFIHVHHLEPISISGKAHSVNPIADLRPVCPNCHAVIHLSGECKSIEEVRAMLQAG